MRRCDRDTLWMVFVCLVIGVLLMLAAVECSAADYYIAFDTGNDANNGTATGTPWQHCPGDTNATNNASSHSTVAGDTFHFKGGEVYYGTIAVAGTGTAGNRITYKGNTAGWGTGKAIIDGSAAWSPSWTSLGGNLYEATQPGGTPKEGAFYRNGVPLQLSQEPDLPDPFFFTDWPNFYSIALSNCTETTIIDSTYLTSADSGYYDQSLVIVRSGNIDTDIETITAFDPALDKITFTDSHTFSADPVRYSIWNDPAPDVDGEIYHNGKTITLYSTGDPSGDTFRYATQTTGISIGTGDDYITVEGIDFRFFNGLTHNQGSGVKVSGTAIRVTGTIIKDCDVSYISANEPTSGGIWGTNADDTRIEGCTVTNSLRASGIKLQDNCASATVRDCVVSRSTQTGLYLLGLTGLQQVTSCTVKGINGTHSPNIAIYSVSGEALVAHCRSHDGRTGSLKFGPKASSDSGPTTITIFCNVFNSGWTHETLSHSGKTHLQGTSYAETQTVGFINNVVIDNDADTPWCYESKSWATTDYTIQVNNNIMQGGAWDAVSDATNYHNYNLYPNLNWKQTAGMLNTNESEVLTANIFTAVTSETFMIGVESPLIDAGTDPTPYLPTDAFPNYDFTKDILGNTLGAVGDGYDIGPWEFQTAVSPPTKADTPSPANSATGISITTDLSWVDGGGATAYDVYFPTLVSDDQAAEIYDPGTLSYSTEYTWRIDSVSDGGTTTGDTWTFTTEAAPVLVRRIGFVGSGGQIHVITVDQP